MNLVDTIKNELFSDGHISQLGSLIGQGEGPTKSAVGAAVPAVLSALASTASSDNGAQKLASAIGQVDSGGLAHIGRMLAGQPQSAVEQGGGLLGSLFGDSMSSGLVNAVSKFTGIPPGPIQKLVSFLMPMILGAIAARFAGKAVTGPAVKSLLGDQTNNIAHALPSGLSLNGVPGLASAGSALRGAADAAGAAARGTVDTARSTARTAVDTTQEAATAFPKWLLPAALGLALLCLVGWLAYKGVSAVPKVSAIASLPVSIPALPDMTKLGTDLKGTFTSLTESLGEIKTAADVDKVNLKEMGTKLDGLTALVDKLPEAERAKVLEPFKPSLTKLEDQYAKLLWIPGVGEKIKPVFDKVNKLAALGGLPVSKLGNASGELAGAVTSLTESLGGIKDADSAEKALPKITDIGANVKGMKADLDKLPDAEKATIHSSLKDALVKLKDLVDKVLAIAGVSEKIKPAVDSVMDTLTKLAA